jgi:hypothetical protein
MKNFSRQAILFMCMSVAQLSEAFVTPSSQSGMHIPQRGAQFDQPGTTTELEASSRRREVFGKLKKAVFAGGIAIVFKREAALAEESPTTGKIVEFQVNNLDGEAGKTGNFKVQLRPEWAPRGVARFEVRFPEQPIVLLRPVISLCKLISNCFI